MTSKNLASLFPSDSPGPQIRQGVVQAWDAGTGENSIQIAGGTLVNLPSLVAESAELVAGDVVAVLSSGDTALVLGKVTTPGDPGTVPTWNADLEALAPLSDLAAVTTGTTITGATNIGTPDVNGAHVVVNDPAYPGQIALYSNNPSEIVPGRIMPILGGASFGVVEIRSPELNAGGNIAYLLLEGYDDDHTNMTAVADNFRFEGNTTFTLINWSGPVQLGDGTDFVTVTGKVITGADLSSLTNTFPTFPYYYGYLSASVAITTSGTPQKITSWVDDGTPNSSGIADPSSGNWTVPTTGRYRLRAQGWWAAVASPVGVRTVQWVRVSPNNILASHTVPGNSATSPMPVLTEKTVLLNAGEQIFVQVIQTQANGHQLVGSNPDITYAQIEWVGP